MCRRSNTPTRRPAFAAYAAVTSALWPAPITITSKSGIPRSLARHPAPGASPRTQKRPAPTGNGPRRRDAQGSCTVLPFVKVTVTCGSVVAAPDTVQVAIRSR
ncbi:dimethylaniline monooxygenase N-oxide forming [Deinococcus grandis]|uniref:Dimethylaniline monooxygenase N-oxide forming n=1 Tax=Deinococcus grandis TaxID=57498 RepID=A0A100HGW6_9DEIO|nr:hypothetical protein DEGR_27960 [Deinococcus grandis]GAQ20455.1 dimethylaniline monooxygenase N-oxide forming [Deinococcus grandis]